MKLSVVLNSYFYQQDYVEICNVMKVTVMLCHKIPALLYAKVVNVFSKIEVFLTNDQNRKV